MELSDEKDDVESLSSLKEISEKNDISYFWFFLNIITYC